MARCPFAVWAPAGTPGGAITPRVVILHVTAVLGKARPHSGLEWHFHVALDGTIEQLVDTSRRADANNRANGFAISIETEGLGDGEWTPQQVESIVRLVFWCHEVHGIPLRRCDGPFGSGIGHHTMWGAPSDWTPEAKSCPGPNRKVQFDNVILPRLTGAPPTPGVPVARPVLRQGSTGVAVGELQDRLWVPWGYDQPGDSFRIFGAATDGAVRRFQAAHGLAVDGVVGPLTWAELYTEPVPATAPPPPAPGPQPSPPTGLSFEDVKRAVKEALREGVG